MIPTSRSPIPPGEILLEEFMKPLELTQEKLVTHLGGTWSQSKLSEVINGKRRITEAIALDFADAFGNSAEFWLNLQTAYDLWHARRQRQPIDRLPRLKTIGL